MLESGALREELIDPLALEVEGGEGSGGVRPEHPDPDHEAPALSAQQEEAAAILRAAVGKGGFSPILLDGVTGAGKTEVMFEAMAECFRHGRQALFLLPEIALTSQFLERFERRFGAPPAPWHSRLAPSRRGRIWRGVAAGRTRAVIGARSALFLPFAELGLIIVDEEHEAAYKQESQFIYHGRDMAVARAMLGSIPVILSSATPSIESHVNAISGRYRHVRLTKRFAGASLPAIEAIDLRTDPPERGRWLSPKLAREMAEALERGEQSLLFLNRRGYAPLTLCRNCGHRLECPNCTAWLVEHRRANRLVCHHCGHETPRPRHCPECGEEDSLTACGPGVERVAEEVAEIFPTARVALLSSDMAGEVEELRALLEKIKRREIDIIIGTQLVAKGHHFPGLALVGVVDGDLGLAHGDPRAGERSWQLLQQVTGRAGRADIAGRGYIQTHMPEHPVMQALVSGDRERFLREEAKMRERGGLPPFGRLAALIVSSKSAERAFEHARNLARLAPPSGLVRILGPAEAPIFVIRGRARYRLLLKAERRADMQAYVREWLARCPQAAGDVKLTIDIDPHSFM
jgi:primosomal protein N' (replication factor Y)